MLPFEHHGLQVDALEIPRTIGSRTITATEVESWFGRSKKLQLRPEKYGEIAAGLTKMRWPSDRPAAKVRSNLGINQKSARSFWDFEAATKAAKTLLDDMPAMLSHWQEPEWSPEHQSAYNAISVLNEALITALPYIEWPLGPYEVATGRKAPKDWHMPSILIAKSVIKALVAAGDDAPGITHNSLVVGIIQKALIRMQFPQSRTLSRDAIGAHLKQWNKKWGDLPRKPATALVTK
jgi:hypothetical protein